MILQWQIDNLTACERAYAGKVKIGMIEPAISEKPSWSWSVTGITLDPVDIAQGRAQSGYCGTRLEARKAVYRVWNRWLKETGLKQ